MRTLCLRYLRGCLHRFSTCSFGWIASADARKEFPRGKYPVLHKLYVIRDLNSFEAKSATKDEPCIQFLNALIPVLDKQLFASES